MEILDAGPHAYKEIVALTQTNLTERVKNKAFHDGFSVKLSSKSGRCAKYTCTDASCNWQLVYVKDNVTKKRSREECFYHVSKKNSKKEGNRTVLMHMNTCTSRRRPSCRMMVENMISLKREMSDNPDCCGKSIIVAAKADDDVDLEHRTSTMYRARNQARLQNKVENRQVTLQGVKGDGVEENKIDGHSSV